MLVVVVVVIIIIVVVVDGSITTAVCDVLMAGLPWEQFSVVTNGKASPILLIAYF